MFGCLPSVAPHYARCCLVHQPTLSRLTHACIVPPPSPHLPSPQFEEMYEQRRREVNKEFEKYQKQLKAAKKSGSKAAADKVTQPLRVFASEPVGMGC